MRYSKDPVSKALRKASGLLTGPIHPAAEIAQVLSPYMDCTEITGAAGQAHDDMRSSIFGLMGDAYRRENNVQLAAQWYRRASLISPGSHAPAYAHMVREHQLADFYSDALTTLEAHQRRRLAKPVLTRLLRRFVASRKEDLEKGDLEFLRQHAVPKAA
jgi:hypothetical protein